MGGEELAGRPRPLRSRNDIKVFQERRARDAPCPATATLPPPPPPPPLPPPVTIPSRSTLPITLSTPPRVWVYFSRGGFKGVAYRSITLSLVPLVPCPPLIRRVRIRQKCVCVPPSLFLPTTGGRSQNGDAPPSLHSGKSQMRCVYNT